MRPQETGSSLARSCRAGGFPLRLLSPLFLVTLAALPLATAIIPLDVSGILQPGAQVETDVGICTLNFVFKDAQSTYLGTAGHCAEGTGDRVATDGVGRWGTIVLDMDGATDFALIKVDAARVPLVRADVRNWGGPTGVASPADAAAGDVLALYGYGVASDVRDETRAKQGILLSYTADQYAADTWAVFGDSGGPILDKATGKAVGIVSQFNLPVSTDVGPTVQHILAQLAARGYNVQLQTAASTHAVA